MNDILCGDVNLTFGKFFENGFMCYGLVIVKLHPSVIVRKIIFSRVVSPKFINFCFKWYHKLLFTIALKKNVY